MILIEAYNEGYYGITNIPKQYYIYPKFSNCEIKSKINNNKQSLNNNKNLLLLNNNIEKKINNINNPENNNILSSYINYPYPKLINISSNYFSQFHFSNSDNNSTKNVND